MRKRKTFLEKFYTDQAKRVILQSALHKAYLSNKKRRIKYYTDELNTLENEMVDYIRRSKKIINKINFDKEAPKYRMSENKQKELTLELLGEEMTVDELQIWAEKKVW